MEVVKLLLYFTGNSKTNFSKTQNLSWTWKIKVPQRFLDDIHSSLGRPACALIRIFTIHFRNLTWHCAPSKEYLLPDKVVTHKISFAGLHPGDTFDPNGALRIYAKHRFHFPCTKLHVETKPYVFPTQRQHNCEPPLCTQLKFYQTKSRQDQAFIPYSAPLISHFVHILHVFRPVHRDWFIKVSSHLPSSRRELHTFINNTFIRKWY